MNPALPCTDPTAKGMEDSPFRKRSKRKSMKTQFDYNVRVVSLANLAAMCERMSGMCNGYHIDKVTTNRVYVRTNSSPSDDESFGHSVTAVFPAWPSTFDGKENPTVALDILRIIGETEDETEASQYFEPLMDCDQLWRNPETGEWQTEFEIYSEKYGYTLMSRWFQHCIQFYRVLDKNSQMVQTFAPGDPEPDSGTDQQRGEYRNYQDAQRAVVEHCKKLEGIA